METPSSEEIVKDFGEGLGKGIADSVKETIKELVWKFNRKELLFIQEKETIELAREQLKTNEHAFYQKYIKEEDNLNCAVMGLTLRRLDIIGLDEKRENLVRKIQKKYNLNGVHISYLVQNGVLNRYIIGLLEEIESVEELNKQLKDFLDNVEKYTLFVKTEQHEDQIVNKIRTKLVANSPIIFIISGMKSAAGIVLNCFNSIKDEISSDYEYERYSSTKGEIIFLKEKKEIL